MCTANAMQIGTKAISLTLKAAPPARRLAHCLFCQFASHYPQGCAHRRLKKKRTRQASPCSAFIWTTTHQWVEAAQYSPQVALSSLRCHTTFTVNITFVTATAFSYYSVFIGIFPVATSILITNFIPVCHCYHSPPSTLQPSLLVNFTASVTSTIATPTTLWWLLLSLQVS